MIAWPPTAATVGSVIQAYWAGDSIQKIMADLDLPDHHVRAILYDAGGRIPRTRVSDDVLGQISRLAEDGVSHTEIKRTTGADYRTVFMVAPGTAWAHGGGGDASAHRKAKEEFEGLG